MSVGSVVGKSLQGGPAGSFDFSSATSFSSESTRDLRLVTSFHGVSNRFISALNPSRTLAAAASLSRAHASRMLSSIFRIDSSIGQSSAGHSTKRECGAITQPHLHSKAGSPRYSSRGKTTLRESPAFRARGSRGNPRRESSRLNRRRRN